MDWLNKLLEVLKSLATPAIVIYAVVVTVMLAGGPALGVPYDLTNPMMVEALRETHPKLAEAALQEIPQDSSGWVVLFIGQKPASVPVPPEKAPEDNSGETH